MTDKSEKMVGKSPLATIALIARSESRVFIRELAKEIKERDGSVIHLYCFNPQEVRHYQNLNKDNLFTSIVDANILLSRAFDDNLDQEDVYARARRIEEKTGTPINHFAVPDRHLGRGYALGGYYHPRSRYSETIDYLHMVHAFCATLEFWEQEFAEKAITCCINGTREAHAAAIILNIPYRVLVLARHKNLHYWAWTAFYENPLIEERWNALSENDRIEMERPYFAHSANRDRWRKMFSLPVAVKNLARTTLQYAYWRVRGYAKARGYFYWETMLYHYRLWSSYREVRKLAKTRLSDMEGKRFVYYPLHVEPETALQGLSPEYFYQHALIAAVSRDLPVGCFLAVKEAYGAIGRRPKNFYRHIDDLKNVVWLDTWEPGLDCVRKSDAVVTICGTAGLEAVASGKPAIAFGHHNLYNFLPSVQVVDNESKLKEYLQKALDNPDAESIRAEGERLLKAITDVSFDMGSYDYIDLDGFEQEVVQNARHSLIESLGVQMARKAV